MSTTEPDIQGIPNSRPVVSPLTRGALNLPNLITVSRLLLALVLFALIDMNGFWLTSAVLFLVAAATDFLDGWVARRYGLVTTLGRILDPFVDKIIVCGAFIFLLEKTELEPVGSGVMAWIVLIVVGREMFITSLRGFMEQHGMDFSATWSGKWKMGVQCAAVVASLLSLSEPARETIPRLVLTRDVILWAAVAITVWSGVVYVIRAGRMLRDQARAAEATYSSPKGMPDKMD